jgi:hypothetical protein
MEGDTEKAFMPFLRNFLLVYLEGKMPKLDTFPCHGRLPKRDELKKLVTTLFNDGKHSADAVIALTDVYTKTSDFTDAGDARKKMSDWVGPLDRFYPHAAQHEFEAWLLPYWSEIQKLAGHNKTAPGAQPETVNHNKPPSRHIGEIFLKGKKRKSYIKRRDAARILQGQDLMISVQACPELKAFINTILTLCGAEGIK